MGGSEIPREVLSGVPAFLIDLDGTVYTEAGVIRGAVDALRQVRGWGIPLRFVTNTTRLPRGPIVERVRGYGVEVAPEKVFTAVLAAATLLRERGLGVVAPFLAEEALSEFSDLRLVGGTTGPPPPERPDAVLLGDLGDRWTHQRLNEAFRYVMDGAALVAVQRNRYWLGLRGLELDVGPYVAALEYATDREATVCGNPEATFFHAAPASVGVSQDPNRFPAIMVGDDIWADIQGAQQAGLRAWLVRTGKFRAEALQSGTIHPDRVIGSVADLGGQG